MSAPSKLNRAEAWLEELKSRGYRLTAARRAVVEVLSESDRAISATEIYDLARKTYPALGLVSVYRTVEKLEELALVQRVHQPDGCHAYIAGFSGHQHLLLCRACGRVQFFRGDDLHALIERVEQETGYEVGDHWLQLFGRCRECREAGNGG